MVRVRFAPSPTGYLHIGGARTALFNWMYARAQGGTFILRIEDTDQQRSKKEFEDEILQSMRWLGLNWDELYYQSQRFDLYRQYAAKLLEEGKAYKEGEAVILKVPQKQIKIYDLIRDEIVIDTQEIKDQVLMKSDGSPTYSFACVIDDALMAISCVIRGEDHISNTPKQILIYEALGFKPPKFAHLPLILDDERARLSKRAGAVAASDYRKMGFLPEAIVNYLMLLGWSPGGNEEIVTPETAIKKFSIKKVNKTGAAFSMDKLRWINAQYLKKMDSAALAKLVRPVLEEHGVSQDKIDGQDLENIVNLYKSRMVTINDLSDWTTYLFKDNIVVPAELREKFLTVDHRREFEVLAQELQKIEPFTVKLVEERFRAAVEKLGLTMSDVVHAVRVALTGNEVGPGLFDTMVILGKEKTIERLQNVFKN